LAVGAGGIGATHGGIAIGAGGVGAASDGVALGHNAKYGQLSS